ncbi:MAG: amidase [Anaerolineales bacterium]
MDDICFLSAKSTAELIRRREVSSQEVVEAYFERVDEVNPSLNAIVRTDRDRAIGQALDADNVLRASDTVGPLHGVPFTVKDNIETEGVVCSCGTEGLRNNVPSADAIVVSRIRHAGGILIGKTNVPELGMGYETHNRVYGRTNNPYDLTRTCGGSSGGEASIIASGGSAVGICTDGGGSARWPAHCCGLAGFKPTTGRTPKIGHVPPPGGLLNSLWQISVMARYVEDIPLCLNVICGRDAEDPSTEAMPLELSEIIPVKQLRIAYYMDNGIVSPNTEVSDVVQTCVDQLASSGAKIVKDRPPAIDKSHEIYYRLMSSDGGLGVRDLLKSWGTQEIHQYTQLSLDAQNGRGIDADGMAGLMNEWDLFQRDLNKFSQEYDAIICPVSTSPATMHGDTYTNQKYPGFAEMFSYMMTFNLLGWPCGTVRAGTSQNGLPIGIQIAAAPWQESIVISILKHLESIEGWARPAL